MRKLLFIFFVLCVAAFANTSHAKEDSLLEVLKILKDNGTITSPQYEKLRQTAENDTSEQIENESSDVKSGTKGGVEFATYDGKFAFELGGRLMVDAAYYDEDKNHLGSGTELRRARIELEGILFSDWAYEFSVDFADGEADIKDAYIGYEALWPLKFFVGQFKEPFSLEELTNSKYITFMERPSQCIRSGPQHRNRYAHIR